MDIGVQSDSNIYIIVSRAYKNINDLEGWFHII